VFLAFNLPAAMGTLGWKDAGSVILSKNEALRALHDSEKPTQQSKMQVWSRRKEAKERKLSVREEKEQEEAQEAKDLELSMEKLIEKRPESRLKWLTKALLYVGRKTIKASTLYEIIMDKAFLIGIDARTGSQMKASILANGHLFSPKQQKALESPTNHFSNFAAPENKKKEREKEKEKGGRDSDRRGRDSDYRDERRDRDKRDRDDGRDRDDRREKDSGRRRAASEDRGRKDYDRRKRHRESSSSEQDDESEEQERRPRRSEKAPAEASSAKAGKRSSRHAEEGQKDQEQENSMDPRMFAPGAADR